MRLPQLLFAVFGLAVLWPTRAANILFVFPYNVPSQCNLLTPYIQVLKDRGHQLTLIHAFKKCVILDQIHSIFVDDRYKVSLDFDQNTLWTTNKFFEINSIRDYLMKTALNVLDNTEVKKLMQSGNNFDLIVVEPSQTDALFGLAGHFNASLIGLATSGGDWNLDNLVGYTSSSTFEPILPVGFRRGDTLMDRLYNWILVFEEWLVMTLVFVPGQQAVHDHFFAHLNQNFDEIRRNFSIILLNQHFSLFDSRPNVPSLIEVGGMHVPRKVPELPPELAKFIDGAEHGVIYMSLGTEIQSCDLSPKTLAIILDTFSALPQRVIWKFEGNQRPNVSDNILLSHWLPQQAILAHPNVRLFICHGGMLGIIEATHYAKPILGMPLFFDQFRNVERMMLEGAGLLLDTLKLTRSDFESAIRRLLDQPQFRINAQALSHRFRDQPMHPLDTAVFWTEYVLRHKGAPYMRINSYNFKLVDYYYLDTFLFLSLRISLLIGAVAYALHKLFYFLKGTAFINFPYNPPPIEIRRVRSN